MEQRERSSSWGMVDIKDDSSDDLVEVVTAQLDNMTTAKEGATDGHTGDVAPTPGPSQSTESPSEACRLVWSKSKVYVHPTAYLRDNVAGFLGVLRNDQHKTHLAWIPERLLDSSARDKDKWVKVELHADEADTLVSLPAQEPGANDRQAAYTFSVPISSIYSLIVRPPTLSSWYGSVVVNMFGGVSLPTLYFHDDESRSTQLSREARVAATSAQPRQAGVLPPSWGGEGLLSQLRRFSDVFPSQLEPSLFLINPNREDREAHCSPTFADDVVNNPVPPHQRAPPRGGARTSILHQSLNTADRDHALRPAPSDLTFNILNSFSRISRNARTAAQSVLSHKLARPIIPHLPEPIASLAYADQPEFVRWSHEAGTEGYDVARVYLARWSQIVAAEGERSRRTDLRLDAGQGEDSALGAFELLKVHSIPQPLSDRAPSQPIQLEEWTSWSSDDGVMLLSEAEGRKRIFQRGLAPATRPSAWPFLLGVFPWKSTGEARSTSMASLREDYEKLKAGWKADEALQETDLFKEESHRIGEPAFLVLRWEIDCRRTDRTQPMFAGGAPSATNEPSNMPPTNKHVAALGDVLMTYNTWEKELGYVQGMSDLCAPLYVVFDGDQAMVFWCFVKLMDRMKTHFLRDQSGMKAKLSMLQQLLVLMDPQLHAHLDEASSLNLFFCFRWILIHFKREFAFEDVLKIWEAIWSDVCGPHTDLFLALAILESMRDVIIRYLREFDEVLRFVHDAAGTLEVDTLLAQTQVLWLAFEALVSKPSASGNGSAEVEAVPDSLRALLPSSAPLL